MNKFIKKETKIKGVYIIKPQIFEDNRGFFYESYNKEEFSKIGIDNDFIQDNVSFSKKGVIRGIHFQKKYSQAKLIRVLSGKIYDVIVDIRKDSPTFGEYIGIELNSKNQEMIYIDKNLAHGFLALEDSTIMYKCDDKYAPQFEDGIIWNDEDLNIDWDKYGISEYILSFKDKKNKSFKEYGKNILILGSDGQLGKEFQKLFTKLKIDYFAKNHKDMDIIDTSKIEKFVKDNNINTIINCASYNDVDGAQENQELCYEINSYSVKRLMKLSKKLNIDFITYSSDFVFDGKNLKPYKEEDKAFPLSIYGDSKYRAEKFALEYEKSLIIRTSWVYSEDNPKNFINKIKVWAKEKNEINLVIDQISSPTKASNLAKITWELIKKNKYGLYNYSDNEEMSRYTQGKKILEEIGYKGKINKIKQDDLKLPAKRPKYSMLDISKIKKILKI